jgi:hypothetical protein
VSALYSALAYETLGLTAGVLLREDFGRPWPGMNPLLEEERVKVDVHW